MAKSEVLGAKMIDAGMKWDWNYHVLDKFLCPVNGYL